MLNLIATIVSNLMVLMLLALSFQSRVLRFPLLWISAGMFVSVGVHSIFEFLESSGHMELEQLLVIMPLIVSIGSILVLVGGSLLLYRVVKRIKNLTELLQEISKGKTQTTLPEDVMDDELSDLNKAFERLLVSLKLAINLKK